MQISAKTAPSPPHAGVELLSPGRFAVILAALVFASFPQVLIGWQTFVIRDYGFFAYPLAHFQRDCFWRGELPFWNPYNNCGVPFLAQWNTMPLYPPALIYLLLPLEWSLSFFCLLHLFFAGLGMYFLAYRWSGNRWGAAVAGLAFAFNGLSLNLLMWPSHIATLSWMPWVVLAVERAWREGGRFLILAALAGAMQMLAGGPETILFTWMILTGMWICEAMGGAKSEARSPKSEVGGSLSEGGPGGFSQSRWAMVWRFALVVLLVAGLAAAQLLPFLDLAAHSQREGGYADTRWSMPSWGWANFFVPMVFGSVWNGGVFFQYDQAWTSSYYLGVGVLLLAWIGLRANGSWRAWLLAAAAAFALALAFGDHSFIYRGLRALVPQLSLMTYPIKFVTIVAFAVPLLAARGVARLQLMPAKDSRAARRHIMLIAGVLVALIAVILFWAWRFPFPSDHFSTTLLNGLGRAGFLLVTFVVLMRLVRPVDCAPSGAAASSLPGSLSKLLPFILLLVLWLDVLTHEPAQNPTVPPSIYTPNMVRTKLAMHPQPELGQSRAMVMPEAELQFTHFILSDLANNFLVKRLGYFGDCNLLDRVPKVNGFFSLYPREGGELVSLLYGITNMSFPHLADFMSVSQVTSPGKIYEWEARNTFLPLVTAGQAPVFLADSAAQDMLLRPEFDGSRMVLLPPEMKGLVSVNHQTVTRAMLKSFTAHEVVLEVEASEPSLVVISQTFYHPWHALVDNQTAPLLRANYAFQAVQVAGGRHLVRLVYQDRAFQVGAAISLLTLTVCGVLWFRLGERRHLRPSG